MPAEPTIHLRPDPDAWRDALSRRPAPSEAQAHDRSVLGLPTDRPVVMSGHQPVLWHAGILAKLLAAAELAASTNAAAAWIVADMDEVDPVTVRVPHGSGEAAAARTARVLTGDPPDAGVPAAALPPREPAPQDPDLPGLAERLAAHAGEPTLALQMGRAVIDLAAARFALATPTVFACSDLTRTTAWATLLDAVRADPAGCVRAYNESAAAHPEARVRPLALHARHVELPLWRVRPGMPRLGVFAADLDAVPPDQLRPRALAMTAIARAALCDLFVHGTGGGRYDRVTEGWLDTWANAPGWTLAQSVVATADVRADLGVDPDALPDASHARWLAHHARHDPGVLDADTDAVRKADLLEAIRERKRRGDDPAPAFAAMQDFLRDFRARHADRLRSLDAEADRAESLRALRDLAADRTWPWPVLPAKSLDALHRRIRAAFAPATMSRCADACSSKP